MITNVLKYDGIVVHPTSITFAVFYSPLIDTTGEKIPPII